MIDETIRDIADIDDALMILDSEKKSIDAQIKQLKEQREQLAFKVTNEMLNSGVCSTDINGVTWSVRNVSPKVIITDEALLPPKFIREKVTKAPDKILLKAALSNGEIVQGATLSNGSVTLVAKGKV